MMAAATTRLVWDVLKSMHAISTHLPPWMMGLVFLLIPDWIVQGIVYSMLTEMGFAMRMKLQDVQTLLLATTMPARQMTMGPAIIVLVPLQEV